MLSENVNDKVLKIRQEIQEVLSGNIIPFWLTRSVDAKCGGYIVSFDENGIHDGHDDKHIVTQTRMIWGFSHLQNYCSKTDRESVKAAAKIGYDFFIKHFWDRSEGGFFWETRRNGEVIDGSKLVYGQSFAIYALSEYYLQSGDKSALDYAENVFDLLQKYAVDTYNGGYYENLESDWSISPAGLFGGDRKSLDIHMHLMESFTLLYQASGKEIHRRKLIEIIDIILGHMVNQSDGYGYNQFDIKFNQIPAINIKRTWNSERKSNEKISVPTDTTSYGHNVELSWLLDKAIKLLQIENSEYASIISKLLDYSLRYGYDYQFGGIYRDGKADGTVLVKDKEWWQNFEALVGYINGYLLFRNEKYFEAFELTWEFIKNKFMNFDLGETRLLLDRQGNTIIGSMGNSWKAIYHTGRALAECIDRVKDI